MEQRTQTKTEPEVFVDKVLCAVWPQGGTNANISITFSHYLCRGEEIHCYCIILQG